MMAAVISRYGGNEAVEVKDVPVPAPARGEVLVRVHAASVNPVDWKARSGHARIFTGSKFPKVLGCECAGEVAGRHLREHPAEQRCRRAGAYDLPAGKKGADHVGQAE